MADINEKTGLPHEVSLGETFNNIKLAPAEVGAFLSHLGASFSGGPHAALQTKLAEHGAKVTNPETYSGGRKQPNPDARIDEHGREVTPSRSASLSDVPPSTESLNPGYISSVPVANPARVDYSQREPVSKSDAPKTDAERAREQNTRDDVRRGNANAARDNAGLANTRAENQDAPRDTPNNAPRSNTPPFEPQNYND